MRLSAGARRWRLRYREIVVAQCESRNKGPRVTAKVEQRAKRVYFSKLRKGQAPREALVAALQVANRLTL
jgi:hypothetical protein